MEIHAHPPIYVCKSIFSGSLFPYREDHEILGVLSLIFWTLTIIPLLKYAVFVLGADDNGEGGTFALYSLLCRHSRMGILNATNEADKHESTEKAEEPVEDTGTSLLIKQFFEKHHSSKVVLLLVVLLGTSMVIGDGILSPTMSVLSAVSGLQVKVTDLHDNCILFFACIILVGLFALQHYGTHIVGFLFAPLLICWLICITGVGIYNIYHWNPCVLHSVSPYYIYNFFKKAGKDGWSSLGGIVLCITGAEAMYADLGHFSKLSIRIGFTAVLYPCLVLAYMGEVAYLSKHRMNLQSSFYKGHSCVYHCHSCNGSRKSSNNLSYILHLQSMQGPKLLPTCEDNTHIEANTWTNIHTRNKLDPDAAMSSCSYRLQRYQHDWQCIWPCCDHSHVCYKLLDVFDHHYGDKRYHVSRIGPPEFCFYRCILVSEFLKHQSISETYLAAGQAPIPVKDVSKMGYEINAGEGNRRRKAAGSKMTPTSNEVQELMEAKESGVAYIIASTRIKAKDASYLVKKFAINIIYGFLRRNSRRSPVALGIPHASLIEIGMLYLV
ncbi:hypothetical protein GOBAR_AA09244 [Gossypium barbadense]|uniref:Potassium transporter n=1 Tax=Gossypium barbadense TaxID=3634 RepID=A0A2P5Y746_GOSBA|nr:hypothetical protein GOBAR_AA09244 [Gossypium barbadense]